METISRNKGRKSLSSLRPESGPLTSRNQKILIVGIKSSIFVVTSDVSQGLLLEPLSFLISIRFMVKKVEEDELFLLWTTRKSTRRSHQMKRQMNYGEKNNRMYDWTKYLQLKLYPQKCNVLRLSSTKKSIGSAYYSIGDRRISTATTISDQGITFIKHVSFESIHINEMINKAIFWLLLYRDCT